MITLTLQTDVIYQSILPAGSVSAAIESPTLSPDSTAGELFQSVSFIVIKVLLANVVVYVKVATVSLAVSPSSCFAM